MSNKLNVFRDIRKRISSINFLIADILYYKDTELPITDRYFEILRISESELEELEIYLKDIKRLAEKQEKKGS